MKLSRVLTAGAALATSGLLLTAAAPEALAHTAAPPARACGSHLETWFAPEGSAFAGGAVYVVEFSDTGRTACTVTGFPTVTLTENGRQVGLKAMTTGRAPSTVRLTPGLTAHVALTIHDAGAVCRPHPANGLSVLAPGTTHAQDFPLVAFGACRHRSTMDVDAVRPHVGIPLFTIR